MDTYAQRDGKFSFTISSPTNTSAGVFKSDGTLVRTLWNNKKYGNGTYAKTWDGKDDQGKTIASPDANYQIKVLTNNVSYEWQGTIGNSSENMAGPAKHRGYYFCMRGMAFTDKYGYFCTGYSEASPSVGKFLVSKPQEKINFFPTNVTTADNNFVATDGINVYWGAYDAYSSDNSFVYGTKVLDDSETTFPNGLSYVVTHGKTYLSVISKLTIANGLISGLAVQKNGNYLFVARSGLNQLQVVNKTTGALIHNLSYSTPKSLCVDDNDNLWMVSGNNTVSRYTVNNNGSLTSPTLTLSGLIDPLAIQVSANGNIISVADGGTSQQVKSFNTFSGAFTSLLGDAGGYFTDPNVRDNKFYFNDARGNHLPFIAYQPDGSFWVNDPGNFRVQHYNSNNSLINRIMFLGSTYSTWVDKNNIKRVFANYLEFEVDYSVQTLTGSSGWSLVKNWGANITSKYDNFSKLKYQTTLSNGRTYAFLRNSYDFELVELPSTGSLRFTGVVLSGSKLLCSDGSLQDFSQSGSIYTYKRYPLTGFDWANNPVWSGIAELLATGVSDEVKGNPISGAGNQIFSTTNKVIFFNPSIYVDDKESSFTTGYHLGLMQKGANNTFLFQTEKSTHRNYSGEYPIPGYFDVGNGVNNFAGGNVNIVDRNIITSYHGEFWKNTQTNKYNHYYDNGLAIGQFGTTRPEAGLFDLASPMMAGNALSPVVVKDSNGDLYLWHGDESDHSGVHRWKITGLNTIAEQIIPISFPEAYVEPFGNYLNLMEGLPFSQPLQNNTAGWTRDPSTDAGIPAWAQEGWKVNTSRFSYKNVTDNDVFIEFLSKSSKTNMVSRDLGTNNVSGSWKVEGFIGYTDNAANADPIHQYFEILDDAGRVLTTFYPAIDRSSHPLNTSSIQGNEKTIFSITEQFSTGFNKVTHQLQPFSISIENGIVAFQYADYPVIKTGLSDANANWHKPKTLRARFIHNGQTSKAAYTANVILSNLKFYKDYSEETLPPATNHPPVANAGSDMVITLPTNSAALSGSGTDADGSVSNYSWSQISGPQQGAISNSGAASTQVGNLIQGVYQFELTVTDNAGATAKDIVQVIVKQQIDNEQTVTLLPAVHPANTVNGLDYKYYEGTWNSLPAFSSINPIKTGTHTAFDLSQANSSVNYGFSFTGFINVPADGQYTFYTSSDDGSSLYIDNILVVANDGLHGNLERSGTIGLKAGKHAITGLFFQQGGGEVFIVSYEGMGVSKQEIPEAALYRISLKAPQSQSPIKLLPAVYPANAVNGLDYKYYEGNWNVLPAFPSINPVKTGTTVNFNLSLANRAEQFGVSFTGYIEVPADGEYTFYTLSDDGSSLYIDDVLVVSNDGLHSAAEKSGTIGLEAGKHAVTGLFFQQRGAQVFEVSFEGMGITKRAVPESALYRITENAAADQFLLPAVYPANAVNGLDFKYYEGTWDLLPSFPGLNPVKTGTSANFDISHATRVTQFGFGFTGFIDVPADGVYTFYTNSDDGSRLYIDNVLTVENDGLHTALEKSGIIGLKAGKHAITGLFFQRTGNRLFVVSYEGMGISKKAIPANELYRVTEENTFRANPIATVPANSIVAGQPLSNVTANSIGTGSKFLVGNRLKVYPNPTQDFANLSITTTSANVKLSISVYNSLGLLVSTKLLTATQVNTLYQLDMTALPKGIYSVVVTFENGEKITYQLTKG